jgi:hypothetical protein
VVELVQLAGVEVHARGLVTCEGVVLEAVPQALDHVHELVGALVARGRVRVRVQAEVAVHVLSAGGHHVPGGAALADVVQRGELARQQVGVFVGGGRGGDEADVFRHRRQRGPQRDRLEVREPALAAEGLPVALVPDAGAVGHEHLVEQAALGGLCECDVVVNVHAGIGLGLGVAPGGDVVAGGHDESAEAELSLGLQLPLCHVGFLLVV